MSNIWKSLTIWFILFTFVFSLPNDGFACSCDFPDTAQESVRLSDHAFVGKVISIQQERTTDAFHTNIQFKVQDALKNVDTEVLTLKDDLGSCGIQFKEGSTYIVYANYGTDNEQTKEYLKASYCLGTTNIYTAIDDLYELKAWESLSKLISTIILIVSVILLIIVGVKQRSKKRKLV